MVKRKQTGRGRNPPGLSDSRPWNAVFLVQCKPANL